MLDVRSQGVRRWVVAITATAVAAVPTSASATPETHAAPPTPVQAEPATDERSPEADDTLVDVDVLVSTNAAAVATTLEGHRFTPSEIRIPANVKVRLVIDNRDASAEEFDSHALNREKVVPAKSKVTLFIGPLAPERYPFIGEFNAATAHGEVIAQ